MFTKTISSLGTAAFVALILAASPNVASAAILLAEKFSIAGKVDNGLNNQGDLSVAQGTYSIDAAEVVGPNGSVVNFGDNDFIRDVFVYDVFIDGSNTAGTGSFANTLTAINANNTTTSSIPRQFGIRNLRFAWFDGAGCEVAIVCVSDPNSETANFIARWTITDGDGFDNGAVSTFFNSLDAGTRTLVITGQLLDEGGGYKNDILAVPLPPAALLFGTALFGIGALRRWKDKKQMAVSA